MTQNSNKQGLYCDNARKARMIFEEHGSFILGVFESQVDAHDAQDLYQNLYTSILAHPVPESTRNIRSYLYRAAINDVIDFKRKEKKHIERMCEYTKIQRVNHRKNDPAGITEMKDAINNTFRVIKKNMPEKISRSIELKLRKQLNNREISEEMGIKIDTVKKYVSRGLKNVQAILNTEE